MSAIDPRARGHVASLDGVRAIAVVLVLLFHLQIPGFAGGFMGVDVFFVLSGFLITSLLLAEQGRTGRVSLPRFWARRARRLLPAISIVLLAVAASAFFATPVAREALRGDLVWSAAYVGNWHFINTASYFANTGLESPLLHVWSLAVEEQFYVVWPLVVAGLLGVRGGSRTAVGLAAASLALGSIVLLVVLWEPGAPERAYMGSDARVFEPLIGAVGATLLAAPRHRERLARVGVPVLLAGAAAVAIGVALLDGVSRSYYTWGAPLVSLGTLAVVGSLAVDAGGRVGRFFGLAPVAWLGAISYGVYLWHWPMALWLDARDAAGVTAPLVNKLAAATATVGVAALSYWWVEQPIRDGLPQGRHTHARTRPRSTRRALVAVPLTLVSVAGFSLVATAVPAAPLDAPVVMMTGDSVPLRLRYALEERTVDLAVRFVSASFGGCPVSGETPAWPEGVQIGVAGRCPPTIRAVQDGLIRDAHPDVVVWWDRFSVAGFFGPDGRVVRSGTDGFWAHREAALAATAERLSIDGAVVLLVGIEPPGPGWSTMCDGVHPQECRWRKYLIAHFDVVDRWNAMLETYARDHPEQASFIDVAAEVCHDDRVPCDDRIGGLTARPDGVHYEGAGAELASGLIWERLRELLDRT